LLPPITRLHPGSSKRKPKPLKASKEQRSNIMMQRKKSTIDGLSHSALEIKDDGESTKKKATRVTFTSRMTKSASNYCLPGVPPPVKLILLSFLGFAFLVVLTAKGHHNHWHYHIRGAPNNLLMREPHMPEPLLDKVQRHMERSKGSLTEHVADKKIRNDESASSIDPTQRMLAQPSRFVDSEKKLKQQLLKLLERQNDESKNKPKNPNDAVLGIKISNRYLGEDLLPYPDSRGDEKEWEKRVEMRKANLERRDKQEWNEMKFQYDEAMEKYEEFYHPMKSQQEAEDNNDSADSHDEKTSANTAPLRPPRGTGQWPSPSEKAGPGTTILLKPAFGSHRPSNDAIFVFAEGYDLSIYLAFVESLRGTGYDGDLVLSISAEDKLKPDVKKYLQSVNSQTGGVNIVAYEVDWTCFSQAGESVAGANGGVAHCKMNNAFGDESGNPIPDPREPRPVATARYELYWIWSLHYKKESWLMLIDARDVWFQLHPFGDLISKEKVSGELHLFGVSFDPLRRAFHYDSYARSFTVTFSFLPGKCGCCENRNIKLQSRLARHCIW
jgi:hypothetical protein